MEFPVISSLGDYWYHVTDSFLLRKRQSKPSLPYLGMWQHTYMFIGEFPNAMIQLVKKAIFAFSVPNWRKILCYCVGCQRSQILSQSDIIRLGISGNPHHFIDIGGLKFVNPLMTKLTFSVTRYRYLQFVQKFFMLTD